MSVDLYRFVEGGLTWTLTSADKDYLYGASSADAELYVSTAMGRSSPETRRELSKANLEVYLPLRHELSRRWLPGFIDTPVTLTVFDHDPDGDTNTIWKGRLAALKPDAALMALSFESVFTSMRRSGLRRKFQRSCPHVLYRPGCNLSRDDWAINALVIAVNGTTVTVHLTSDAAQVDGYFVGGMIEAPDTTLRFITGHTGASLTLIRIFEGLSAGDSVRLFPGCDRSKETCNSKFGNLDNNGSFPYIPINNPFGGSAIA